MPVLGLTDVLHHKGTVCWSYDILITSIIIALLGEELIKKNHQDNIINNERSSFFSNV